MASSTDKPGNTPPAVVTSGRMARFKKIGGTATTVGARHAFQRLKEVVTRPADVAEQRRALNAETAQHVARTLASMKGAAMKVGQILSVDPNVLPPEVREALSVLQKDVPPMPWEMVRAQLEGAFGKPVGEVFGSFDEQPMGAASIGQVHRATTREGEELAVKVQYPGVADTIDDDVKNLGSLLGLAKVALPGADVGAYLEEFRLVLHREADYQQEAASLERFTGVLSEWDDVRVPRPFNELTRKNVLSMELVRGRKLDEHLLALPQAERDAFATRFLEIFMRLFHEKDTIHADPHPGNFMVDDKGRVVILDFGCVRDFEPRFTVGLANIMRAHWSGDAEALPGAFRAAGFTVPEARKLDPETLYEYLDLILAPFVKDVAFEFSDWDVEWKAKAFMEQHWEMLGVAPPREALFYMRLVAGLKGMLARTGSRVNVYRAAREQDRRLRAMGR